MKNTLFLFVLAAITSCTSNNESNQKENTNDSTTTLNEPNIPEMTANLQDLDNPIGPLSGAGDNPKDVDCNCGPSDTSGDYSEYDGDTPGTSTNRLILVKDPDDIRGVFNGNWDGQFPFEVEFGAINDGIVDVIYKWKESEQDGFKTIEGKGRIEDGTVVFEEMVFQTFKERDGNIKLIANGVFKDNLRISKLEKGVLQIQSEN